MNIGELFINLGIKGTEKTVGAIASVRKGMGEITSTSIEAKAAIIGAMYGLERLVETSNRIGTSLTNFNALTGISVQELQRWQYAARQAGVSGEEIAGSMKSVQNAMTNMLFNKGAPEGLGLVAEKVGFDFKRARDTLYVLQQLQKFAQQVPADVGNAVLKSFGLSEGTIAAMRRNAFTPEMLAKAPTYSDKEVKALDKANIAWSNLINKIQMAIGHFNALHGLSLVNDISKLTDKILQLANSFMKLADNIQLFKGIGMIFEGWTKIFDSINFAVNALSDPKKMGVIKENLDAVKGNVWEGVKGLGQDIWSGITGGTKEQNIEINQNLNFQHDGTDSQKNADSHKKAIQGAFRQFSSQGQGS